MKAIRCGGLAAAAVFVCASGASAEVLNWTFELSGLQEVPPVDTTGSGLGMITFDTDTNLLSWDISFQDLLAPTTAAHFHGPANFGETAGPVIDFTAFGWNGMDSPIVGSTTLTDVQAGQLVAGLWYANVHSTLFPAGEIRGQVVPSPGAFALVGLAGLALMVRRGR